MTTLDSKELVSLSDANKLGLSSLVSAAERGEQRILLKHNRPVAAIVSIDSLERQEELEEALLDISLALTRLLTTSERRHTLDDVLDRFGITREELED